MIVAFRLYDLRERSRALQAADAPITHLAAQLGLAKPTMKQTYAPWLLTADGRRFVRALELHRAGRA